MDKRQKILIVDDSKLNRDILKEILGETMIITAVLSERWSSAVFYKKRNREKRMTE